MKKKYDFTGFPKEDFRERMIAFWQKDENINRDTAFKYYAGDKFDILCNTCDGTRLLSFKYDEGTDKKHCFEIRDNNFVIPVSAIDKYWEEP